jgi:transposase
MAASGRKSADLNLVTVLAAGATIGEAAERTGVSERTIYRRLADLRFRNQIAELRAEMVQRAVGKLADSSVEAVETLHSLLNAESESAKLGAARSILELGTKLRESVELEQRLQVLEARAIAGNL